MNTYIIQTLFTKWRIGLCLIFLDQPATLEKYVMT